jgi:hypothetical protein
MRRVVLGGGRGQEHGMDPVWHCTGCVAQDVEAVGVHNANEVVDADFEEIEEVRVVCFEQGLQFVGAEGQVGVGPGVRVRREGAEEGLVHGFQHV